MDDTHTPQNPNPSSSPRPNTYQISGVPVEFPYKPYGSQLAFMSRVISTLDRARRQGHCNALLESPTGTGKTLSLLCSTLAWQQHRRLRPLSETSFASSPLQQAAEDPLLHGGGFIPEPDASENSEKAAQATKTKDKKKRVIPTIYYASRTHSQISQVIREYRKTSYRVPMAVLASRKHYCTNKHVSGNENVDEVCKLLLKDSAGGCLEFKNANKVKAHPSLQIGGCLEVHDIEDLVRIGQRVKGCSYFAAQTLAAESQLVFCPYSYIINPIVRRAMDVDIKGCIVILDEAHNIEDMAREGGSVDIEEEVLHALQAELGNLCMRDNLEMIYRPLYDVIQGIISWINIRKDNLQKCEFEHYLSYWTGEKAKQELRQAGFSQQYFPVLQECATKAIKEAVDAAPGEAHLSGISIIALEGLFSSLSYFFSGNGCHANDYQLALQRYVKRDETSGWTTSLSLWCLNPAVVFREIADLSLSVILTSGTLSPMGSFSSELGVRFDTCMEAPHIINSESQLWATVISSGVDDIQLNASYKTADSYAFQDSLGATLEEICKIVPGGALVFFPSYKLLEKLHARWCQTGQWSKLSAQKEVFIEPRGSSEEFESVLRGYYDTISGKSKPVPGKTRRSLKRIPKHSGRKDSPENPDKGAAFLAVCRGKVSEGIDFSDDNARVVVIVGIPFPNTNDIRVILKKKYNDTYKSSKNLLSGSDWYCHQAFRALNQAAGRCIRHRFDYGAIILLDDRYKEQRNITYISKWLRDSIKYHKNVDDSLEGLQVFFQNTKQKLILKEDSSSNDLPDSNSNHEKLQHFESSNWVTAPMGNQKIKMFTHQIGKMDPDKNAVDKISQLTKQSNCIVHDSSPVFQPQTPVTKTKVAETNESFLQNCIADDLDNKYLKHLSSQSFSSGSSPDLPLIDDDVKDTFISRVEYSYLPVLQICHQFPEVISPSHVTTSNGFASDDVDIVAVTPEKLVSSVPSIIKQDSPFIMSVNSYSQKKRRPNEMMSSDTLMNCSNFYSAESPAQFSFCSSTNMPNIINQRSPHPFVDTEKAELELVKLDNQIMAPLSTDACREMELQLQVCCISCKNPLGLPEKNFIVRSLMTLSSKVYLSYIRTNGALGSLNPWYLSETPRTNIHVLRSDILFINQQFFKGRRYFSQYGEWCEEDGCVFRTAFCPFCTASDACLGVHVLATDASNVHLQNKVLLYADCLCIKDGFKTLNESVLCKGRNFLGEGSVLVENPKSSSDVIIERPYYDTKKKLNAIEDKSDNPWYSPVENEKYAYKVLIDKPATCPKQKPCIVRKNADSEQTMLVDIEKFPCNSQTKPVEIEKFAYRSHPKSSEFIRTSKSKLKLPRRE